MLVKSTLSVPDFSFQLSTCHSYAAFQCSSLHCFNGGLFFCLDATSECGQTGTCIKSRKMGTFTWKVPDEGPSEEGESGLVKEAAVAHGRQKQEGWFCEQTPGLQCQMWLVFVWMSGLNWSAVVPCMTYVSCLKHHKAPLLYIFDGGVFIALTLWCRIRDKVPFQPVASCQRVWEMIGYKLVQASP